MIDEADVGVQQDGDVAIPQQDVAIGAASLSLEKNSIATKKSTTKKFNAASAVETAPKKSTRRKRAASPETPPPYEKGQYERNRDVNVAKNMAHLDKLGFHSHMEDSCNLKKKQKGQKEVIYEVESFIGHKVKNGKWMLLTKWVGFSDSAEDVTWEPLKEKLEEVPDIVKEYMMAYPVLFSSPQATRRSPRGSTKDTTVSISLYTTVVCIFIFIIYATFVCNVVILNYRINRRNKKRLNKLL